MSMNTLALHLVPISSLSQFKAFVEHHATEYIKETKTHGLKTMLR